jgi:hypothetical protein
VDHRNCSWCKRLEARLITNELRIVCGEARTQFRVELSHVGIRAFQGRPDGWLKGVEEGLGLVVGA